MFIINRYLKSIGLATFIDAMNANRNVEIFDELLSIISETNNFSLEFVEQDWIQYDSISWLESLTTLKDFLFLLSFVSREVRIKIVDFIGECNLKNIDELQSLQQKYL
jgi:hypothetical protein